MLTPYDIHYGRAADIIKTREETLIGAYEKHPERFKGKLPKQMILPKEVLMIKRAFNSDREIH